LNIIFKKKLKYLNFTGLALRAALQFNPKSRPAVQSEKSPAVQSEKSPAVQSEKKPCCSIRKKALLFNQKKACGSTRLYRIGLKPQQHHRCSIYDADRSRRCAPRRE